MSIPKHNFIMCLGVQDRLQTKGRLHKFEVCPDDRCCICGLEVETIKHLFFECSYSTQLLHILMRWINITPRSRSLAQRIMWSHKSYKGFETRKQVLNTVLAAVTYQIWRMRNGAYWDLKVDHVNKCSFCLPKDCQM